MKRCQEQQRKRKIGQQNINNADHSPTQSSHWWREPGSYPNTPVWHLSSAMQEASASAPASMYTASKTDGENTHGSVNPNDDTGKSISNFLLCNRKCDHLNNTLAALFHIMGTGCCKLQNDTHKKNSLQKYFIMRFGHKTRRNQWSLT